MDTIVRALGRGDKDKMLAGSLHAFRPVAAAAIIAGGFVIPAGADNSVAYGYDEVGRLRSALYDNGLCITYSYDAVGNRISQTNTLNGDPIQAVWGVGSWGCFKWTSPP